MHTTQPVGCHALKTQWTRTIKSCEWRNKGEKTTIHSTSVRGMMVLFHFKINLNDLLSASHIHDSVAGRILCCCWHRYAWKSPSYPWLCIPFGKGCRESMHNCTWWWGCGNEAFVLAHCQLNWKAEPERAWSPLHYMFDVCTQRLLTVALLLLKANDFMRHCETHAQRQDWQHLAVWPIWLATFGSLTHMDG